MQRKSTQKQRNLSDMNSQMTLQRLNAKSNVNARLFNDIRQNLINLRQKQCQIHIQWILSCKSIIKNEKADQLIKIAAQEVSVINNIKAMIDNEIYLYEMLTTNLLQAMLVRRAKQSHRQSSNSAIRACYAHIHRSSIALRCSQTTRSRDQMIMWSNSEQKLTSKWSAFTIHRLSIASRCSQTT